MAKAYQERDELARYIWHECDAYLTPFERQVRERVGLEQMRADCGEEWWRRFRTQESLMDPEVLAAVVDWENFLWQVCQRVLREHGEGLLNRCPRCRAVRRTPKARYCLWCRHDERTST